MEISTPMPPPEAKTGPVWAMVISGLFHPLLIASYMFMLLLAINPFLFGSNDMIGGQVMVTLIMMILYTFVIPLISVLIMVALNMVNSVMLEDRMQRIGPLLLVMVLYFWVYYNLHSRPDIPTIYSSFLLGVVMALSLAFVINVADKISLHTVGMGGLTGMVMICLALFGGSGLSIGSYTLSLGLLLIIVVLLAGLVGSARLSLSAHTKMQIYMGYVVGFLTQFVAHLLYF